MSKFKSHFPAIVLLPFIFITAFTLANGYVKLGNILSSFYFISLIVVTYFAFDRYSLDHLRFELVRKKGIYPFLLNKMRYFAYLSFVDTLILTIGCVIAVILRNGTLRLIEFFMYFVGYYVFILFYKGLILVSRLLFKTSFYAFLIMFALFASIIFNILPNAYLNPFATLWTKFWIFKPVTEPDFYSWSGLFANMTAYAVWTMLVLGFIDWKKRRLEL